MYVKPKETAEELTSDVFFALWENRKILTEVNNFDAYIYRIAKHKILNYLRTERPEFVNLDDVPIDLFASTQTTPEDELISRETIERVNEAVEQLPPQAKLAFKLVREDGMKYSEAAAHLGIAVKTVEAHLTTAMKKIREALSHE
jgi:RNA polymerase sigma-70 factor (ECF subfamily)